MNEHEVLTSLKKIEKSMRVVVSAVSALMQVTTSMFDAQQKVFDNLRAHENDLADVHESLSDWVNESSNLLLFLSDKQEETTERIEHLERGFE